jgi:tetratricopeptide (TPR) repeat protein
LEESYYTNLGSVYFEMNKFNKAIIAFEKSEKAHNNQDISFSKYNWYYLGYCYLNRGAFKQAIINFDKYLIFYKNNYEIISLIGKCHAMLNEYEAALAAYERAVELEPNNLETHIERINILTKLNRKEEVLELLKNIEQIFNDRLEKKIIKVIDYKINNELTNAILELKEVIKEIEADNKQSKTCIYEYSCILLLSQLLREHGDYKDALFVLESAMDTYSSDLWFINAIAMEYADQSFKTDKAIQLIDYALKYQPENPIFLDTKGWILFKLGSKKEAIDIINKSLSLNPNCKETKDHLNAILNS